MEWLPCNFQVPVKDAQFPFFLIIKYEHPYCVFCSCIVCIFRTVNLLPQCHIEDRQLTKLLKASIEQNSPCL